jgi:Amt family ammonium transporter
MASAAAMLTWVFLEGISGRRPSAVGACIGAVVGLVAITPAAGFVSVGASLVIGVLASAISYKAVRFRSTTDLDDTLDVFPCHGIGGMVGMILTGVFASTAINAGGANGLLYGGTELFGKHLAALLVVAGFSFVGSFAILKLVGKLIPLRVEEDEEAQGLDLSQHAEKLQA